MNLGQKIIVAIIAIVAIGGLATGMVAWALADAALKYAVTGHYP